MAPVIAKSAAQAVSSIEDNEYIWCHSMAATPYILLEGLSEHALSRKNLTLMQLHTEKSESVTIPELRGHLRNRAYFVGGTMRKAVSENHADYVPCFLSEIPKFFRREEQRVDTALIQISPPDKHGKCSLGISVEATRAAIEMADKVIAQINPNMPRTHGDSFIDYHKLHAVFECASELPEHPSAVIDDVTRKIGENVASKIDDGSCMQMGIGAIPDAALACLGDRQNLGIHTEMFSDGVLDLVEKGVINGKMKRTHPGKIVTGFVIGSRKLYDFVDDNPEVIFADIEYVNDTATIRKNDHVVSINSALQVDLSGQVCADSIGTRIYSGVGGQMDFVRGASLSYRGRAIIALPATAAGGKVSRISSCLTPGAGVVTTRAHAHYIMTEYGIANLRAASIQERAKQLIDIAAPQFREGLQEDFAKDWGITIRD